MQRFLGALLSLAAVLGAERHADAAPVEAKGAIGRALDDIRRQYPHGYFSEERRALTILALARVGNVALARQQATRFLSRYPNSPFADKVRAAAPPQTKR